MTFSKLKSLFFNRIAYQNLLNNFFRLYIDSLGNYNGITLEERDVPIVVSLTSVRENFGELPITLYSLLNQSVKPDRLILWLDEEYEDFLYLPYEITQFAKNGLEVRFVKNLNEYTKSFYALKEFESSINIIVQDDKYYPKNWLKKLYLSYIAHPEDIQVHKAKKLEVEELEPLKVELNNVIKDSASFNNFILADGGVLFPPNCYTKEFFRKDIFMKYALLSEEAWYWVMALLSNRKIRLIKNAYKHFCTVNLSMFFKNKKGRIQQRQRLQEALIKLMFFYKSNIITKAIKR